MKSTMDAPESADGLAPTLLLSMPQMVDPNFSGTVVLLCDYSPDGALGLVVNRPTDTRASTAVALDPPPRRDGGIKLWSGGPVDPQRGWILTTEEPDGVDYLRLADGLFLSTSPELLRQVIETASSRARVLTGYAGWGPGQLDEELAMSAWLTMDVDLDLLFNTPASSMWEVALRRLGADPGALQLGQGVH